MSEQQAQPEPCQGTFEETAREYLRDLKKAWQEFDVEKAEIPASPPANWAVSWGSAAIWAAAPANWHPTIWAAAPANWHPTIWVAAPANWHPTIWAAAPANWHPTIWAAAPMNWVR